MNSHAAKTKFLSLLVLVLLTEICVKSPLYTKACLPRVSMSSAKSFLWRLFGQSGGSQDDDVPPESTYDEETKERATWTTNDWILKHNFSLELHNVTTKDGYQLQMQRLPLPGQRPVLLLHGLMTSSLAWVCMGTDKSLAFLLHQKQYDVWLANFRGSSYGRNHSRFAVRDAQFWNFSFHEMGYYDLPALIDEVRNETSFHQVLIIGHSQAFNAFLVLCSMLPEYNHRILLMQALAPIAILKDYVKFDTDDVKVVMKYVKAKSKAQEYEMLPPGFLKKKCLQSTTEESRKCKRLTRTFTGNQQYSKSIEYLMYSQLLQGGALKEIHHLHQIWKSGDFVGYDYDPVGNLQHYNTVEPLNYDLKQVTTPIVLYFGASDAIATPNGVHRIYASLLDSVIGVYRIAADKFNHFDFFAANEVKSLVNDKVIDIMDSYLAGKLKYVVE